MMDLVFEKYGVDLYTDCLHYSGTTAQDWPVMIRRLVSSYVIDNNLDDYLAIL